MSRSAGVWLDLVRVPHRNEGDRAAELRWNLATRLVSAGEVGMSPHLRAAGHGRKRLTGESDEAPTADGKACQVSARVVAQAPSVAWWPEVPK